MLSFDTTTFPVLHTERLILRELLASDAAAYFELRNNEEAMQYINRESPKNLEETQVVIKTMGDGFKIGQNAVWGIAFKENPDLMIGNVGYWRIDLANHRAELGYILHPDHWRKGILSEALAKVIDYGFAQFKFHSLLANISPANDASRQLLVKNGFVKEAYFKEDFLFRGRFLDSEIYGLLNPNHLAT